jgi:hypothetical protein
MWFAPFITYWTAATAVALPWPGRAALAQSEQRSADARSPSRIAALPIGTSSTVPFDFKLP